MFAPLPATASQTSRPASESTSDASPAHPASWCVRAVQIAMAIYLLPVLALMVLIGGVGMVVVGLVKLVAGALHRGDGSPDAEPFAPRS
jgi:hypothetical protein